MKLKSKLVSICTALVLGVTSVPASLLPVIGSDTAEAANTVLWRLGKEDNSSAEFTSYLTANPENVTVPSDWSSRTSWSFMSKGMKGSSNPNMNITFNLATVPANGVELKVRVMDAYKSTPQLGVWSNGVMAGLIQIAGVSGTTSVNKYKRTYRLYIPKELLQTGTNSLKFSTVGCMTCSTSENQYLWWDWDYVRLESLENPAPEPIHGRYVHMGTTITEGDFGYNLNSIRHLPSSLKWLGIAHSGNVMRAAFWSDLGNSSWRDHGLDYLKKLKDYNMRVVADHLNTGFALESNGTLPASKKTALDNFFATYGPYIHYYEIDNEPGLFNRSKALNLAIADYVSASKPAHVKSVAPGWAYWPNGGDPDGWERDPLQRLEVENKTQLTNGHSYGSSNVDNEGGSFTENLETLGSGADGLPKEMLATETGTDDGHTDPSAYGSNQPHAASFDRILRGHVGFTDHFLQHAAYFHSGYGMFDRYFNWSTHDPAATKVHAGYNGTEDPRLKTFRRLALAYATHGKPLPYTYLNKSSITNKKVIFRGVNTATLGALPGSGATSNKVLLNFVNFENTAQTMQVRVTMPTTGAYTGERFGAGSTYASARSVVTGLNASPTVDLTVSLGAGESVQYILEPQTAAVTPAAPSWIMNKPGQGKAHVYWLESPGAASYTLKRSTSASGPFTTVNSGLTGTSFTDTGLTDGTTYYYVATASNSVGQSGNSEVTSVVPSATRQMEAESDAFGGGAVTSNDSFASGGKNVGQMQKDNAFVRWEGIDGGAGGTATLTIRYATAETNFSQVLKSLFVNGVDVQQLNFPKTPAWCCTSTAYADLTTTVNLTPGFTNSIMIKNTGSSADPGGLNLDKITLVVSKNTPLAVSAVTASGNDGNVPANVTDNNLSTRWSADGNGQWLRMDLGSSKSVSSAAIGFFNGDQRKYSFDLQASTDGTNWTTVWTGQSNGATLEQEYFDFPNTTARYIRYLGHGSNVNTWNSVTEVDVFAP